MKEKVENYLKQEEEIKQRINLIQKDPMTHCDTSLMLAKIKELDAIEISYRAKYKQIIFYKDQLTGEDIYLNSKTAHQIILNFSINIKCLWEIIQILDTRIKKIDLQESVIVAAERSHVFDLDSIEKRMSLSQERHRNLFFDPSLAGSSPNFIAKCDNKAEDPQEVTFLDDYFPK